MPDFDYNLHVFTSPELKSIVSQAVTFFDTTPLHSLPPSRFEGPGVYALYYHGSYYLYEEIARRNAKEYLFPIYIGEAVPPGSRKGISERKSTEAVLKNLELQKSRTTDLWRRLSEHSQSIKYAKNLNIEDFRCRFMILKDIESDLILPVETELIRKYKPIWNQVVMGFGNHDPGRGRYQQRKSEWDFLHPGRPWSEKLTGGNPLNSDSLEQRVLEHIRNLPLP